MAINGRPRIDIFEKDIPTAISASATGRVVYVVESTRGEYDKFLFIENEQDLVNTIGAPSTLRESRDFHVCKEFLRYGSDLVLVRITDTTTAKMPRVGKDASNIEYTPIDGFIEDIETHAIEIVSSGSGATTGLIEFYTKDAYDETLQEVKVAWCTPTDFSTATVDGTGTAQFSDEFEFAPLDSRKEIALIVTVDGTITEKWIVSLEEGFFNDNGENHFITEYLKNKSSYINAFVSASAGTLLASSEYLTLTDGDSGNSSFDIPSNRLASALTAYSKYADKNAIQFDYIIDGTYNETGCDVRGIIIGYADTRKDCMAFIGAPVSKIYGVADSDTITTDLISDKQSIGSNSSYASYYGNIKQVFDKYRKKNVWIPITGDAAGVKVRTNTNQEVWTPPAGYNYGVLVNASLGLGFNPSENQQDNLYNNQVNIIFNNPSKGTVIFGQKTLLNKNSGFNRVNVRELFIFIEQTVASAAENFLFELNTAVTRRQFVNSVEPFLSDIQNRGGIQEFRVICDESNNTGAVIDNNEFRADILIKPSKAIEFVRLSFFNVPSGVSFDEVTG